MVTPEHELDLGPLYDLAAMYRLVHHEAIVHTRDEVLGESNRRRVWELADGDTSQVDMAQSLGISRQAVGHHTRYLAQRGLLRKLDDGHYRRCLED